MRQHAWDSRAPGNEHGEAAGLWPSRSSDGRSPYRPWAVNCPHTMSSEPNKDHAQARESLSSTLPKTPSRDSHSSGEVCPRHGIGRARVPNRWRHISSVPGSETTTACILSCAFSTLRRTTGEGSPCGQDARYPRTAVGSKCIRSPSLMRTNRGCSATLSFGERPACWQR
jgi:hypothetical protein